MDDARTARIAAEHWVLTSRMRLRKRLTSMADQDRGERLGACSAIKAERMDKPLSAVDAPAPVAARDMPDAHL